MKLLYLSFFLFLTFQIFGQTHMKLHLRDCTIVEGDGKFKRNFVKIRKTKKEKPRKIYLKDIHKIIGKNKKSTFVIYSMKTIHDQYFKVQLVERGKVNIYKNTSSVSGGYGTYSFTEYYFIRDGEPYITQLVTNAPAAKFRKKAANYFEDCPILVDKIKNREDGFKMKNVKEIAQFYNTKCK